MSLISTERKMNDAGQEGKKEKVRRPRPCKSRLTPLEIHQFSLRVVLLVSTVRKPDIGRVALLVESPHPLHRRLSDELSRGWEGRHESWSECSFLLEPSLGCCDLFLDDSFDLRYRSHGWMARRKKGERGRRGSRRHRRSGRKRFDLLEGLSDEEGRGLEGEEKKGEEWKRKWFSLAIPSKMERRRWWFEGREEEGAKGRGRQRRRLSPWKPHPWSMLQIN